MNEHAIIIDRDFTHYPGGRHRKHGKFSGEEFRDDFLVPALHTYERVIVDLDGVEGYASSFLEEAFGGLVREAGYTQDQLRSQLEIRTVDPKFEIFRRLVEQHIRAARARSALVA
jgi:hypothetical protein